MLSFFLCCRLVSRFSMLSWMEMLSIDIGLLVIRSEGCEVRVWVMVICCCWLFDSLWGWWLIIVFVLRCIWLRS